ncbi:MAG: FprA family A-type flavoprotein [Clostridiales bacterium]|nr:FprA family A-type flavoprotein [Clostridiales bacterium]
MYDLRKITDNITWVGACDRRIRIFEGTYPIEDGMNYNSYLIADEKTVLVDTVDKAVANNFFENISAALNGRSLDYLIVQHMEPDHSATLGELVLRYPDTKIVVNQKTMGMISRFFGFDIESRAVVVGEGDTLDIGSRKLTFVMAPMVHWPEVMLTYDPVDKVLFSADAFGNFGAIDGSVFADSLDFEGEFLPEARRYYTNIVGKYGAQVQMALKKAAALDIKYLCPLHGLVWRKDLDKILGVYDKWSRYEAEEKGVAVLYGSVYGNSANCAQILAGKISDKGLPVKVLDMNVKHFSHAVAMAFKYDRIVIVTPTVNAEILVSMDTVVRALAGHNVQNKKIAVIDNGTWASVAGKSVREILGGLKGTTIIEEGLTIASSLKEGDLSVLDRIAEEITA